jgi:hypothetical protein
MLADTLASHVESLRVRPADRRANRRLARQSAELRERVRFATTSLKRSSQASLSASYYGSAGITRARETDLAEREPTGAWPGPPLVVHTEADDVTVVPSATPGGLACLYQAYCVGCGAAYPGPFRVQPAPGHRAAA